MYQQFHLRTFEKAPENADLLNSYLCLLILNGRCDKMQSLFKWMSFTGRNCNSSPGADFCCFQELQLSKLLFMQFVLKQGWDATFKERKQRNPSSFLNLLCCGSEIYCDFHACYLAPKREPWIIPVTCFPLCSSQIMSPIPPVSSPPLTSKTKELAENENLDVSHMIYFLFIVLF